MQDITWALVRIAKDKLYMDAKGTNKLRFRRNEHGKINKETT